MTARCPTRSWPPASRTPSARQRDRGPHRRRDHRENQSQIEENLQFFNIFLNVVAFIALFVSCFVIYNVFSITVAQRQRENALMRAIGASRRQVTMSLLVESVVVGLVGSILGLGLGMLLAMGLQKAFSALGLDLPSTGLVLLPRTVILTIIVGLLGDRALGAAARVAVGRVPPVAAMRDAALEAKSTTKGRTITGLALLTVSVVLILIGPLRPAAACAWLRASCSCSSRCSCSARSSPDRWPRCWAGRSPG